MVVNRDDNINVQINQPQKIIFEFFNIEKSNNTFLPKTTI